MDSLMISLLVIFVAITLIPLFSREVRLPVIVLEIIFGILVGKSFLDLVPVKDPMIDFFSSFGLVYLMFLAGLEIDFDVLKKYLSETGLLALFSVALPFIAGVMISSQAGVHPLLLGTIFSTTSLGIVLPLTKEIKCNPKLLRILFGSVILVDIISIFLLAFSLAWIEGSLRIEFIYSVLAILVFFLIPWIIRGKIKDRIIAWAAERTHFELEVRFCFALIFLIAAISEKLGFHSIMGAFIAGMIISEFTHEGSLLKKKLEGFGYGFFIPLFFIVIGAKVDLPAVFSNINSIQLLVLVVGAGILSKILGAGLISRILGWNLRESLAIGLFHSARLSLILAVAEVGIRRELLNTNLFSVLVILALTSALFGPTLGKYLLEKQKYSSGKDTV